jgi:hypothetical protein
MIEPITPQQYNNNLTLIALDAVRHLAITLNECYRKFWQRDSAEILASLNASIPLALERFHANTALGTAINAQLEAAGDALRVIVTMPDGYAFNGTAFTHSDFGTNNAEDDANDDPIPDDSYEFFAMNEEPQPLEND